jgi:hypothetical protein
VTAVQLSFTPSLVSSNVTGAPPIGTPPSSLKVALSAYGGVEVAIYTADDQLTLTLDLELYVYARTDRWLYILQGVGLTETLTPAPESWRLRPEELGPAPELAEALAAAAERLALEPR